MKILYIAKERRDAELTAAALRGLTPNLSLSWVAQVDTAEKWIDEHPDVGALLIDADADDQGCAPFLMHVRRRGVNAPGVVIASEGSFALAESLHAGADDFVTKNRLLWRDLPPALGRAMARARAFGARRWDHLRLNSPPPAALSIPAVPPPQKPELDHTGVIRLAEMENTLAEVQEKLFQSEIQRVAVVAERDSLASELLEAGAARDRLERELTESTSRLQEAEARAGRERLAEAARVVERVANLDARIRQECASRSSLQQQLTLMQCALHEAKQRYTSALERIDQLTGREAALTAELAGATAARAASEARLAEAAGDAERRAALESLLSGKTAHRRPA